MTRIRFEDRLEGSNDHNIQKPRGKIAFLLTKQRLAKYLENIDCPHHDAEPRVIIVRKEDSRAKLLIEGCCENNVDQIIEKL